MRVYSQANVMHEYLEQPSGKFNKILNYFSKKASISLVLEIPARLYLKGELISETVEDEIGKKFSQSDLVGLLVDEILTHYSLHGNPLKIYRAFREISSNFIVTRYYHGGEAKLVPLKVYLPKKDVFELEMMIADIEETEGNIPFTVEELLELHYMSFMSDILTGKKEDSIQNIIKLYS